MSLNLHITNDGQAAGKIFCVSILFKGKGGIEHTNKIYRQHIPKQSGSNEVLMHKSKNIN